MGKEIAVYTSTTWSEFIIFRSTFKYFFLPSSTVAVHINIWIYKEHISLILYGYCNISSQTPFGKKHSYTSLLVMKIEQYENDDKVKCWVSYNNYSLHSPLGMDGTVIMLASCHMDKYSSFLLLLEFQSPSHSLSLHMEWLYRFGLWGEAR